MKIIFNLHKKVFLLIYLTISFSILRGQTADPQATQTTKCILQYISGLSSKPRDKVISGQWMHRRGFPQTPKSEFDSAITSIYHQTSKWVGIIGTDYLREISWPNYQITNHATVNQPLIDYFKQGGLVFIMTSLKNPWNGGNSNNIANASNLLDLITPTHPANIQFMKDLDSIAIGIHQLQDSCVTVIFRPLHENNGGWFWWGYKTTHQPADFISVWQFIFNYLTLNKQLHNILWMFSPSVKETGNTFQNELYYYPGNNYVDIIGLDEYNDTLDINSTRYSELIALGKPIGLAEFGPKKINVTNRKFVYDYTILINQIKNKYPELSFFLPWNHFNNGTDWVYYSLSTQNNTDSLLNDAFVVNRDKIDYSNCLTNSINEQNIYNQSVFLSPNPAKTTLFIQGQIENISQYEIVNIFGQTLQSGMVNDDGINISILENGIYFLKLNNSVNKFMVVR